MNGFFHTAYASYESFFPLLIDTLPRIQTSPPGDRHHYREHSEFYLERERRHHTNRGLGLCQSLEPLEPDFSAFGNATTKSYSNLANGNYTFHVKARDQVGNDRNTPATRALTVNATEGVCPAEIALDNLNVGQAIARGDTRGSGHCRV